ncbi:MAG: hypothetical protein P8099_18785 [Gemmatimonadota bacterium]
MSASRIHVGGAAALLVGLAALLASVLTACNTAGGPTTVTVNKVGTINWAAYQDGTGAWQELTGSSFTVSGGAGKYGVAWECPSPETGGPGVGVIQATTAESTAVLAACPPLLALPTNTISGTVSGIPSGGTAVISLGSNLTTVTVASGVTSTTFSLGVSTGVHTLVAYGLDSSGAPSQLVVTRNVSITGNNSAFNVNLALGQAFTLNTVHLTNTPSNLSTSNTGVSAYLVSTGSGDNSALARSTGSADLSYPVLPGSLAQSGDMYELVGTSNPADSTGTTTQQVALLTQSPSSGQSIALPAAISSDAAVTGSGSATTVTWGTATFSGSGGLTVHSATDDFQSNGYASWIVAVTAGWKGSSTTYTFPDFSSTTGWNSAWNLPAGTGSPLNVHALHANLSLEQLEVYYLDGGSTADPNGTLVKTTQHQ